MQAQASRLSLPIERLSLTWILKDHVSNCHIRILLSAQNDMSDMEVQAKWDGH
jgi:hypothetical protein